MFFKLLILIYLINKSVGDTTCNPCRNGGRCLMYLPISIFFPLNYYCNLCQCPQGYSGSCCDNYTNPCSAPDVCGENQECFFYKDLSHTCNCIEGKTGPNCETDVDRCALNLCRTGANCTVDSMATDGYVCECPELGGTLTTGRYCEVYPDQPGPHKCTSGYCLNGGVCFENGGNDKSCKCPPLTQGDRCETTNPCYSSSPCKNEGRCRPTSASTFECDCLNIWSGEYCENYNICNDADNPCIHGSCESTGNGTYNCTCDLGYEGTNCAVKINYCKDDPCDFNGVCKSEIGYYTCSCIEGTTGDNCEINIDDCGTVTGIYNDEEFNFTHCNTIDKEAKCHDLLNGYRCQCSDLYTDENCTMNIYVWEAIQALGGDNSSMDLDDLIDLLNEMVEQPTLIKDMLPFMLALMPLTDQTNMGYDFNEMFLWVSYETSELFETDIRQWYETTLGNCFTFNAPNYSNYSLRTAGIPGGFKALLDIKSDEYLSWIDTEGLNVFIHDPELTIFSESIRYTTTPGGITSISVDKISYKRLDGRYGECVWDDSYSGSYYYDGKYTTDGCLRSCYQDKVESICGCYDPRYPKPDNGTICPLDRRDCVLNVSIALPDPSKWTDCHCPLPCEESQYTVGYTTAGFTFAECGMITDYDTRLECIHNYNDLVLLEVFFRKITQHAFVETPKMGFMTFLSYTGGLLGCMTGISVITLVEFVYLIFRLLFSCASTRNYVRKHEQDYMY